MEKRVYVKEGINDIETTNPEILKEWNYEKNDITPKQISHKSTKKVWWVCEKGHEWEASPLSRLRHSKPTRCPYCATKNRRVIKGHNDLETTHPQIAKEWNYEKNGDTLPSDITSGSNSKFWWKCDNGHEWQTSPNNRLSGKGCPYCANQKILSGYNDLETTNPELAKEWNYEKNYPLTPKEVIEGSAKKVWWKCHKGHDYECLIVDRKKGNGCPYCANKKVLVGYNYLETVNPNLAQEWNYEKNYPLTPKDVIAGSTKKVWWKCKNGHEWQAIIVSRNRNHFCPICDRSKHTSISEKAVVYYLKKSNISVKENFKINKREVDIFIPALGVAIEYDGQYFHKNIENDTSKSEMLRNNNIKLIRIREPELPHLNNGDVEIYIDKLTSDYSYLNKPIKEIFEELELYPIDINVDRDLNEIYSLFQVGEKKNNLLDNYPLLVKEWDYEKNKMSPDKVSKGTHLKVWWKCSKCGHSWEAQIYSRCDGVGCPNCAKKALGEYNKKEVEQYDKEGNFIKTYASISDAERETGAKNIFYVCSGKRKSSGGYIWKYKE